MFRTRRAGLVRLATAYDEIVDDSTEEVESVEVSIPEDLSGLSASELAELRTKASEAFQILYEGEPTEESLAAMEQLAEGVDRIRLAEDELAERSEAARARAEELAARVGTSESAVAPELDDDEDDDDESDDEELASDTDDESDDDDEELASDTDDDESDDDEEDSVVASSAPTPIHLTVSGRRRRRTREPEPVKSQTAGYSLTASADLGRGAGAKMSLSELAAAFGEKLGTVDYKRASRTKKHTVQSFGIGKLHKEFPPELIVDRGSDVDAVLRAAADEQRLPGGSLVASSAGWCAPSQVIYELAEAAETTDGLFSLPEVSVPRGGLLHTLGPDFSEIYGEDSLSWSFTEDEIADGDYDGYGGGSKPSYFVPCPPPVDDRLDAAGVFIKAGLLMNAAYPEVIERLVSGAFVAHEFKQSRRKLQRIIAGSTAVTMPADPVGATAPLLQAIEVQIEDYRNRHRVSRGRTLEVVLPYWCRGAIRSDLSRRLGVDMLAVTNEMIAGFFALRGAAVQFVYELDDMTGDAADRIAFPESVTALIYLSGTWIGGTNAVIDLGALFDSALVEQNVFTQLFTEEGWLVAKRFHDSRAVTIPISTSGHVAGGIAVDHDGSVGV